MSTLVKSDKQEIRQAGELFRRRREEMGISLKEVENSTSIRSTYLQAIEEGELGKLISPVYAQGFVRQYAAFLEIDGEQIIKNHPEIFNRTERQEFAYGIGTLEVRGNPGASVRWVPNILWVGGFCLVLSLAWYLARLLEVI